MLLTRRTTTTARMQSHRSGSMLKQHSKKTAAGTTITTRPRRICGRWLAAVAIFAAVALYMRSYRYLSSAVWDEYCLTTMTNSNNNPNWNHMCQQQKPHLRQPYTTTTTTTTRKTRAETSITTTTTALDGLKQEQVEDQEEFCGLYLAESSIPNAGWGMYTAKDRKQDDNFGMLEVVIPFVDRHQQKILQKTYKNNTLPPILLEDYFWTAKAVNIHFEAPDVEGVEPGFGMLANSHPGLINTRQRACVDHSDTTDASSPAAGAHSHFHDCQFVPKTYGNDNGDNIAIPAGHEIFDRYGDSWFRSRKDMVGADFPLSNDYWRANAVVRLWRKRIEIIPSNNSTFARSSWVSSKLWFNHRNRKIQLSEELATYLWNRVAHFPLFSPRTQGALPRAPPTTTANVAYENVPNAIRSLDWLQTHGYCLDHIVVRPMSGAWWKAQRGAFARRVLPKGTVVAPAPLVHLSRQHLEYLQVDDVHENNNSSSQKTVWQGQQLLLNYCYGHPESSLLLLPYSPLVNLINHYKQYDNNSSASNNSSGTEQQQQQQQRPNIAVRWSSQNTNEWMQLTPHELLTNHSRAGLMMEFYALVDIRPGDELVLDYGDAWQQAWDEHVEQWNQRRLHANNDDDKYVAAFDYAQQCDREIATQGRHECLYSSTLPSWIQTRCFMRPLERVTDDIEWIDWQPIPSTKIRESYTGMHDESHECDVVAAHHHGGDGKFYYKVHLYTGGRGDAFLKIQNVPRSAILLVDRMYTGNQFRRHAFRHEIQLPDEMVPAAWRDLRRLD